MTLRRWLTAGVVAAAATSTVRVALGARPPGGTERWTRRNHRGEPISLLEGPATVTGLVAGVLASGVLTSCVLARCALTSDVLTGGVLTSGVLARAGATVPGGSPGRRVTTAQLVAVIGAGAFGIYDDLAEDTSSRSKGLRGHLTAAVHGELTTGGLKVLGIGAAGLAAAMIGADRTTPAAVRVVDIGIDGALIAAAANLLNLLDLRPGRALKAGALAAAALTVTGQGTAPAVVLGTTLAAARADLAEADMLGDGGANALGALLGAGLALGAPRPVRVAALAVLVALTVASEKVSFSRVIADTPWLAAVDAWGRRAPAASDSAPV